MTHSPTTIQAPGPGRGGRTSSPKLRQSIQHSQDFCGLEEDIGRYDLLLLVKRVGQGAGFSPKMIQLLDYYINFTRDIDWEQGSSPIVYQSLSRTALDLGISERQVQRLEQALFDASALTWNDSGNHKRYGQRCAETGMILYAFGVDLSPLAYLKPMLQDKLHEKQLYDKAWMEAKRQISWYRRQIRGHLAELEDLEEQGADLNPPLIEWLAAYGEISMQIRTHLPLEALQTLLKRHKSLYQELSDFLDKQQETHKTSPTSDNSVAHIQVTNKKISNKLDTSRDKPIAFQGKRTENAQDKTDRAEQTEKPQGEENIILKTGLQHIKPKQALNAASTRFRDHIPMHHRPMDCNDVVEAAYKLKAELDISQNTWGKACITLSRYGAAICLLLTDQAAQREDNPVRKPAAYFNAMISRAEKGELHLHKSIFGHLKKEDA